LLFILSSVLLLVAAAQVGAAGAHSTEVLIGGYRPTLNTTTRLDADNGLGGTSIDLEDDLGMDSDVTTLWGELNLSLGRRSSLWFSYTGIQRSSSRSLGKEITFGGLTFAANAKVTAHANSNYYFAAWRYALLFSAENEFGLSLGLTVVDLKSDIQYETSAILGIPGFAGPGEKREANLTAPAPLVGAYLISRIGRFAGFRLAGQFTKINVSGYTGTMLDGRAGLEFYPVPVAGIGIGYYANRLTIDQGFGPSGTLDYSMNGPLVYLRLGF
jgi:hypothetical protein